MPQFYPPCPGSWFKQKGEAATTLTLLGLGLMMVATLVGAYLTARGELLKLKPAAVAELSQYIFGHGTLAITEITYEQDSDGVTFFTIEGYFQASSQGYREVGLSIISSFVSSYDKVLIPRAYYTPGFKRSFVTEVETEATWQGESILVNIILTPDSGSSGELQFDLADYYSQPTPTATPIVEKPTSTPTPVTEPTLTPTITTLPTTTVVPTTTVGVTITPTGTSCVLPATPRVLVPANVSSGAHQIRWAPVDNIDHTIESGDIYHLKIDRDPDSWSDACESLNKGDSCVNILASSCGYYYCNYDFLFEANKSYKIWVAAENGCGLGKDSDKVEVTVGQSTSPAPTRPPMECIPVGYMCEGADGQSLGSCCEPNECNVENCTDQGECAKSCGPPPSLRVLLIVFDPYLESVGQTLTEYMGWGDPYQLADQHIEDMRRSSGGESNFYIEDQIEVNEFPPKESGWVYTDEEYLGCLLPASQVGSRCREMIDYGWVLSQFDVCPRIQDGSIHEVWLFTGPWFNTWEWTVRSCGDKEVTIYGFNYERGTNEMRHDRFHNAEDVLRACLGHELYEAFDGNWGRYASGGGAGRTDPASCRESPPRNPHSLENEYTSCGNAHYAPNSYCAYITYFQDYVNSKCHEWRNFPNVGDNYQRINCEAWGCTESGFYDWWFGALPTNEGTTIYNGREVPNNWWRCLNGDFAQEASSQLSVKHSQLTVGQEEHQRLLLDTDINGDGVINERDFERIISHYGEEVDHLREDLSGDGVVNALDIVLLLQLL